MKKLFFIIFGIIAIQILNANNYTDTFVFKNRINSLRENSIPQKNLNIFEDSIFVKNDKLCFNEYYYIPDSGLQKKYRTLDVQQIKNIKKSIAEIKPLPLFDFLLILSANSLGAWDNNAMWENYIFAASFSLYLWIYYSRIREAKTIEIELLSGKTFRIYSGPQSRKIIKKLKLLLSKK